MDDGCLRAGWWWERVWARCATILVCIVGIAQTQAQPCTSKGRCVVQRCVVAEREVSKRGRAKGARATGGGVARWRRGVWRWRRAMGGASGLSGRFAFHTATESNRVITT